MPDRILFFIAALFNWTAVGVFLVGGDELFRRLGSSPPPDLVSYYFCLLAVVLFGLGYFWVGVNPSENHAIVAIGAIGKIAVFAMFLYFCALHWVPYTAMGIIAFDLIFAALFLHFLIRTRQPISPAPPGN